MNTMIYAVAGVVAAGVVFWLSTKGLLRDDGEYEDWCSELKPASRKIAMCPFRCIHRRDDGEDQDDDDDDQWGAPQFQDENGKINIDWLWRYIREAEQDNEKKMEVIQKQSEYIEQLVREQRVMYASMRNVVGY